MLRFEDVIKGCIRNDNKSKEMVYKSFYGYLMAVILRYTNNRTEAEELVNDTFIKVFKSIHLFIFPSEIPYAEKAFKAWIGKIASRTAIDFLRTRKSFLSIDDFTEEAEPVSSINVISALNVKDILKLLDDLPEIQRLIFNLFEIEGFSHQEIAKIFKIPESSSRVYLTRAKQKLRTLYSNTLINTYETN
ncbi:sigma-70 family RNA polymerase sigma factor [Pedobacter polaris]|uniref:Sigma-70 family RNA polymerase sigma factor n=1 Tax=Pedobacter polaris TaxID=2571273 RepID=A0A4U1CWR4_9SPHI|nr:sigma-70 family RNA polymerase sigma factor [Pedobacter polaris]TKC12710.1 sigma-70 family RNA polymerase sigma factor [Pedobacter polaris]